MDRPHYEIENSRRNIYLFVSEGKHGNVVKMVKFQAIGEDIVNLGFGDFREDEDDFDDLVITDNGDMEMVLATVIRITAMFLSKNPGVSVYITGSSAARSRLYRIIISNNIDIISQDYEVWGYWRGGWCRFEKNVNYQSFLVSKLL